jgi:hypothetical protein
VATEIITSIDPDSFSSVGLKTMTLAGDDEDLLVGGTFAMASGMLLLASGACAQVAGSSPHVQGMLLLPCWQRLALPHAQGPTATPTAASLSRRLSLPVLK